MKTEKIRKKISRGCYRVIRWLVKLFYPKMKVMGIENLPREASIIVANHTQMNGPIACELYFPGKRYTWCAGQMMHLKEVPAYAYRDFWSQKPIYTRFFYKLLSYVIAPISVCVFNNANTIAVYRDTRIIATFKNTVKVLQEGASVVIFPEHNVPYNHILCDFQENFTDIAKLYYKRTGQALNFVPMYIAPTLKTMHIGKPVTYDPHKPIESQRTEICKALKEAITDMAVALPEHRVIPYQNIPRKQYLMNKKGRGSVEADTGSGLSQVSAEKNQ